MNIHEFQAKQVLGRFGVPGAQGAARLHARRGRRSVQSARTAQGRHQGADSCRRARQGRRRQADRFSAEEARDVRRPAARQTAGDASDRARGPRRAPRVCRGGERGRARALPRAWWSIARRSRSRSSPAPRAAWRSKRSRPRRPNDHHRARSIRCSGWRRFRRARSRSRWGSRTSRSGQFVTLLGGALPRVHRDRRVADRDQSAGGDERRPRDLPGRQNVVRRQRPVSPSRDPRTARLRTKKIRPRPRPPSTISATCISTATSDAWSTARGLRWRRWTS